MCSDRLTWVKSTVISNLGDALGNLGEHLGGAKKVSDYVIELECLEFYEQYPSTDYELR